MCEDAQHRLFRGTASPASPKRPGARRSSALRAWQNSLENQSRHCWNAAGNFSPVLTLFLIWQSPILLSSQLCSTRIFRIPQQQVQESSNIGLATEAQHVTLNSKRVHSAECFCWNRARGLKWQRLAGIVLTMFQRDSMDRTPIC